MCSQRARSGGEEVSCKTLTQTNQKSKKTDKCIVSGYRPKAGVVDQGTTNLVCRQHEFGMGHLRDPAACYLDSTLSEYRRLRPRQKRFLFFLRFSSQDFPVKRDVEKQTFKLGVEPPARRSLQVTTKALSKEKRQALGARAQPLSERAQVQDPAVAEVAGHGA